MRSVAKVAADERGSATIEFCLWVPLFALLLMLTVDVSMLYLNQTRMENIARDAARRVANGQFDGNGIIPFVETQLPNGNFSVSTACANADYACVSISRPVADIVAFGVFRLLVDDRMNALTRFRFEPKVRAEGSTMSLFQAGGEGRRVHVALG